MKRAANRRNKTMKKKMGGDCGCKSGIVSKLFSGGKRTKRRQKGGDPEFDSHGMPANAYPLKNVNDNPIPASARLIAPMTRNMGGSKKNKNQRKRKLRGGVTFSDPLLGGKPNDVILGFGTTAGAANSVKVLNSVGNDNNLQMMTTSYSPKV